MDAVAAVIQETDPHVVSLVEVDEAWGSPSRLGAVAGRCGYASIFVPVFEYGQEQPTGGFGNALLTKVPISAVRQRQLVWPSTVYDGTEPSELRAVVFAKLGPLWVGSTHLPRSSDEARTEALERLKTVTSELDGDWLLCGDFNAPASSWIDSDDALRTVAPDPALATYPTEEPVELIDYFVASSNVSLDAKVLDVRGSDHLAVLAVARVSRDISRGFV
ncbi:endonuclease/exonuclease/phosphatase family protein [Actinocrispum wychmicini]|uniref:endonuclease/exonuclease/phosphatase family protein n=1 Tax=Actinocrispum wychmicini TaxID=1213861 RepID=UPI001404C2B3|nr:endonuclease/exonuclease/phosphatase family protein [Actinocrispum wychmicini]